MLESSFQHRLIKDIKKRFEGAIVLKTDANYIQGFPDLLILYNDKWASLECKRGGGSHRQPNQDYYVQLLDSMSYASYICPDNAEEVLDELQQTFRIGRATRVSKRK